MDSCSKGEKPPNPRARANPVSALTFWWLMATFWRGYRRDLEVSDLPAPLREHQSDLLGDKFERYWNLELVRAAEKKGGPSLCRVMARVFGARLALYGVILAVMEIVLRLMQPQFLGLLLIFFSRRSLREVAQPLFLGRLVRLFSDSAAVSRDEALGYAAGVVLCSAINIFVIHPYMMAIFHMGMKIRVACCSLIYRKALRLSKTALGETTAGQVVNLLSNDVNRFDVAIIFLHYLWIGPLETALVTYLMWFDVGWAAAIGVATILMFIPLQGYLGKKTSTLRLKTAIRTDERVRLMNEIISGIQVIKMYTWEKPFNKLVEIARRQELKCLRATSYIRGVILSFIMFNTRISIFASVLAYVLMGNVITAEKVFVITAYYNILRQTMTVFFPQGIAQLAEAFVSVNRLQKFLLYDETPLAPAPPSPEKESEKDGPAPPGAEDALRRWKEDKAAMAPTTQPGVWLFGATAKWSPHNAEYTLRDVSLTATPGHLVAVVGPVGAGKTSLLHVMLGELPLLSGTIRVSGKVSYASQEPWMFAGSVRQNILFGRPFNRERYNQVVKVCALQRDLHMLPYGDKTVVGERGISLSGGQRARVNLARAVYMNADVYLLDDPLSAVDTHVGKHLFEECVRGYLRDKTVIIITHQLQYLKAVNSIVVLENGEVQAQGSYTQLQASGLDFTRLFEGEQAAGTEEDEEGAAKENTRSSMSSMGSVDEKNARAPLDDAEARSSGHVSGSVYTRYFSSGGNCCVVLLMFLLCVLAQVAASASDYWITYWTNTEEVRTNPRHPHYNESLEDVGEWAHSSLLDRELCIYLYSGIVLAVVVVSLVRSFVFFSVCVRASQRLHDAMFRGVTRAKMHFFSTNPSGRILNRFSKDMGAVDELLPQCMVDTIQIGLALLGIIVVLTVVNYWLLVPTAVVGLLFYLMRVFYLSTSRSIKRLEGVTRSPVFSHLNASLQGLTTIRAFGAQEILVREFDMHQDLHSSAWFYFIASSRAFGFWLDVICVIYIAIVTFSFLLWGSEVFGGNVGLAITQSITLTGMFQWGMRQSAEMENQMTSVERILEYNNIEPEPPLESAPEKKPPPDWPQSGRIVFDGMYLRYGPAESPVLKNLSLAIHPGEKVGIVGRTGAGKSSLIAALFRLAEIEGSIVIDDIDTSTIGLHDLRSKLAIIPQEPVLFTGTMRKNLDPFDEFSDERLWQALDEVEMKEVIDDQAAGLHTKVSEGGTNFSVGQRQLVCLARAIIRNNRILVLDEATANVDPQTDALIQSTIRQKFADCTVLTIAHRLHTVMDSDRVLVMDAGCMVEFGHPHELLKKSDGFLSRMVEQTGKSMAETLIKMAEANYKERLEGTVRRMAPKFSVTRRKKL